LRENYYSSEVVVPVIYRYYMEEQVKRINELKDPRIIYVTDLAACSHKLKLRRIYPEITLRFEPGAILGSLIHAGVEKYLAEQGFVVEHSIEEKIKVENEEYTVKGRVDAYDPEKKIVIEIKSSRDTANKPLEHHIFQLQIYLNMLEADKGILVYITPEGFLEYGINREKINLKSLVKTLVRDEVHPRWSWECRYCVFKRLCTYAVVERQQ